MVEDRSKRDQEALRLLLPEEARARLSALRLRPRILAEGRTGGLHPSSHLGQSLEFSELKPYSIGDDIKTVDFKVLARTDRLYTRRFFDETNMSSYLVVDASGSMAYPLGLSKYWFSASVAMGFAYILLRQADEVALLLAHEEKPLFRPPRSSPSYLLELARCLAKVHPNGSNSLLASLERLCGARIKRGLCVIISDLLMPFEPLQEVLKFLANRGHQCMVVQVLSPEELEFPFHRPTVFLNMERHETLLVDARTLRKRYLLALSQFLEKVRMGCHLAKAFYFRADMRQPPYEAVREAILGMHQRQNYGF